MKTADYKDHVISFVVDSFVVESFVLDLSLPASFDPLDIENDSLESKIGSFVFEDFFLWRFSILAMIDV